MFGLNRDDFETEEEYQAFQRLYGAQQSAPAESAPEPAGQRENPVRSELHALLAAADDPEQLRELIHTLPIDRAELFLNVLLRKVRQLSRENAELRAQLAES